MAINIYATQMEVENLLNTREIFIFMNFLHHMHYINSSDWTFTTRTVKIKGFRVGELSTCISVNASDFLAAI